ncbi:hypothetical protein [Mycobacterium sp. ACS4331]|uniref:hypothetical protein n=1 Tax=Mycobacterium sp. ACS4331 TaxID=1834121 RepID=UPI0008023B0B|nr:hypothetical protein [Mycobacterium sp. ACS4331]OBF11335.1 hypothetical protein A5727_20600 [Mycobacterium sp. ACS4331]
MDAESDPGAGSADNTEPLPVPSLGGYAVRPSRELLEHHAQRAVVDDPRHVPTVLPPFDFSALDMKRAPMSRARWAMLAGAVGLVAVLIAAVTVTATRSEDTDAVAEKTPVLEDTGDPAAEQRLAALLPAGFPADVCAASAPQADALAQLDCRAAADPAERPAARFTLVADRDTLVSTFDRMVQSSSVVVCPGRIQSPGPWRRNATPNVVSGTVFCALTGQQALVAWTDESSLVLSEIRSNAGQAGLDQLFTWWSANS